MRVGLYARVSTTDQTTANQLIELRAYVIARGWQVHAEYVDEGVSGARESRPALDRMLADARRRCIDTVAAWRLDRLGRSTPHLIRLLHELQALGVRFISLAESIDFDTPVGKMMATMLSAIAQFERDRTQERILAGLARVRAEGKVLGRPKSNVSPDALASVAGLSTRKAAAHLGVSSATIVRLRANRD